MLTPLAFSRLIRYLDGVDREVTSKLIRVRPWLEPALTSLLVDLLDPSTAGEFSLAYNLESLQTDLASVGGALTVDLKIELNEYTPDVENRVTQSDLGLVLRYIDNVRPANSWAQAFLLQAKRLPPRLRGERRYGAGSRFSADAEQMRRIQKLADIFGETAVRFLLYCPRPDGLDAETRKLLQYARTITLARDIFDYVVGLEIRDDLSRDASTLEAGVFVTNSAALPATLLAIHEGILLDAPASASPLSWFVAMQFADVHQRVGQRVISSSPYVGRRQPEGEDDIARHDWLMGVVRCERDAVHRLLTYLDQLDSPEDAHRLADAVLPSHTMTVTVEAAPGMNPDSISR